jgi:flagellar basal body-associated protein FliL
MQNLRLILVVLVVILGMASCTRPHDSDEKDKIAEGFELEAMVKQLNHGRTNDLNELLNLKMDTVIIEIDLSLSQSDEKTRRNATNLFQQIAKVRREFPLDESNTPMQVRERVSRVLMEAFKSAP